MLERAHHRHIATALHAFDGQRLQDAGCYFGGGTAIVLLLDEYRTSIDIDFLCSDIAGYRQLRNTITQRDLGPLLRQPLRHIREVRTDRDKISTFLQIEDIPIKVEIVLEARIQLAPAPSPLLGVPVLSREDLYASKLLANADRGLDRSVLSRDIIDLAMMIRGWGAIPDAAWRKSGDAYGAAVRRYFDQARGLLTNHPDYLRDCLHGLQMDPQLASSVVQALADAAPVS